MSGHAMSRILYCSANTFFAVVSALVTSAFLKSFILLACICPVAGTPALKNLTRSSTNISLSTAFPPPVSICMSFRISNLCPSHGPGWISRHPTLVNHPKFRVGWVKRVRVTRVCHIFKGRHEIKDVAARHGWYASRILPNRKTCCGPNPTHRQITNHNKQ
jgi:hypothetical protein